MYVIKNFVSCILRDTFVLNTCIKLTVNCVNFDAANCSKLS